MDPLSSCKRKLVHFRVKELKDVITQLGLAKQGKKQIIYPMMEDQHGGVVSPSSQVKVTFCLGLEKYNVCETSGVLSGQLASMKQESMMILKDYITKHNVPTDVPDESVESFCEDESEVLEKLPQRTKKRK